MKTNNNLIEFDSINPTYKEYYPFKIKNMLLNIDPNFNNFTLANCIVVLDIEIERKTNKIELDAIDLKIHDIKIEYYKYNKSYENKLREIKIKKFYNKDRKIIIEFIDKIEISVEIRIMIKYSAGFDHLKETYNSPKSGVHFIGDKDIYNKKLKNNVIQLWTQGEAKESRYWFPCLDDPEIKFPRTIKINAPKRFEVISNGMLINKQPNGKKIQWTWYEKNPTPAYLTSIIIGDFNTHQEKVNDVLLKYYWPKKISKENAMLSFSDTPKMLSFFEKYFGIKYPYEKYFQITVKDFEFGGMENTSCTTLTENIIHDNKISEEYNIDKIIIAHELSHQWFGDMVTCKDWSHLWLNEGFASYSELLYLENSKGEKEFLMEVINNMDAYLKEAKDEYIRPIVTKKFLHPDDLFDSHSYQKGACVLHMLRNLIGNDCFKESIKQYLIKFKDKNADTNDFKNCVEEVCKRNFEKFFDQWIFSEGHPELEILMSITEKNKLLIRVKQIQKNFFEFPLELRINYKIKKRRNSNCIEYNKIEIININNKVTEFEIDISKLQEIQWISVDPYYKILKKITLIKYARETSKFQFKEMLKKQLRYGITIVERIQAARFLKEYFSDDILNKLKDSILNDDFYGVSVEAANTVGSYWDETDYKKSEKAFKILESIISDEKLIMKLHPIIRRSILKNIGNFGMCRKIKSMNYLVKNESSYFVKSTLAETIGKIVSKNKDKKEKKIAIQILKQLTLSTSFQNIVATGAINGLSYFSNETDVKITEKIINFMLDKTNKENDYFTRSAAIKNLSKFIRIKFEDNLDVKNLNFKIFFRLLKLTSNERRKIKIDAINAIVNKNLKIMLPDIRIIYLISVLKYISTHDIDGFVRNTARKGLKIVNSWIEEYLKQPIMIDSNHDRKEVNTNVKEIFQNIKIIQDNFKYILEY